MENFGTKEGTIEEIKFVEFLNKNKSNNSIWNILSVKLKILNIKDYYAVRVTTKQISKLTGEKVLPKADVYIAHGTIPAQYLERNSFFLEEKDAETFNMSKLNYSGISIKREDSTRYQILKMTPNTFCKIFNNYELGAGASIFCQREEELSKNDSVVRGWNTNWNNMFQYFGNYIPEIRMINDCSKPLSLRIQIAKKLKEYSISTIKNKIKGDIKLLDFIFKGVGNFDEPYTATWFFEGGLFRKNEPFDFTVTTGSGRSHGEFTIVIKP
jgi:hypothetical protein